MSSDWTTCTERLREELPATEFDAKIAPLQPRRVGDKLVLYAPNRYIKNEVQRKYLLRIAEILGLSSGSGSQSIEVMVGHGKSSASGGKGPKGPPKGSGGGGKKGPGFGGKGPKLDKANRFDTFAVGECNRAPYEAALEFAKGGLGGPFNLLLLVGPVGHGKTHLLHAIGWEILKRHPRASVKLCHGQVFKRDVVAAILSKREEVVQKLLQPYRSAQVLLFDDLKFIGGARRTQLEFLDIFNALADGGGRIVVTSDRYPGQFPDLADELRSRLSGGISAPIEPIDQPTAVGILRKRAKVLGVSLRKNVAERLAARLAESNGHDWEPRQLTGVVESLVRTARTNGGKITMDMVSKHLRPPPHTSHPVPIDQIIRETAAYYGVKPSDIRGKRRYKQVAHARHMAMYLCKELTDWPYVHIGQKFGGRHHTTVKAACVKIGGGLKEVHKVRTEHRNLRRILLR